MDDDRGVTFHQVVDTVAASCRKTDCVTENEALVSPAVTDSCQHDVGGPLAQLRKNLFGFFLDRVSGSSFLSHNIELVIVQIINNTYSSNFTPRSAFFLPPYMSHKFSCGYREGTLVIVATALDALASHHLSRQDRTKP